MNRSEEDRVEEKELRARLLELTELQLQEVRRWKLPRSRVRWFAPCLATVLIALSVWLHFLKDGRSDPLFIVANACGLAGLVAAVWVILRRPRMPDYESLLESFKEDMENDAPVLEDSRFTVVCDEWGVRVADRGVPTGSCSWIELSRVEVAAEDADLWAEDRPSLILSGGNGEVKCVVPTWARGVRGLNTRLRALPGFDSSASFAGWSATERGRFLCWERGTGEEATQPPTPPVP